MLEENGFKNGDSVPMSITEYKGTGTYVDYSTGTRQKYER